MSLEKINFNDAAPGQALSMVLQKEYSKQIINFGENDFGYFCDFFGGHKQLSSNEDLILEKLLQSHLPGFYKVYSISGIVNQDYSDAQRVSIIFCKTEEELAEKLQALEEVRSFDHAIIGSELELFFVDHQNMPGVVNWLPKGTILLNRIKDFISKIMLSGGYHEVVTPFLAKKNLWETSGHWEMFRKNMFAFEEGNETFVIKPMSCPAHINIFRQGNRSYRDLPYKICEFGFCTRNEPSGALDRLFRLRSFTQDDAHVFCSHSQIEDIVSDFIKMLKDVYHKFGFDEISVSLSTRPEKFHGDPKDWEVSQAVLSSVAKKSNLEFKIEEGEGAFYGPKLDFHIRDKRGRFWQCGTVQLDFFLGERFSAYYSDSDGTRKFPIIVHHAILGSLERFMAIMIENSKGVFPMWLAPVQVCIICINEDLIDYCNNIKELLTKEDFICEVDARNESVSYKIASAHSKKIPVSLILGKVEVSSNTVSIRIRGEEGSKNMPISEMLEKVKNLRADGAF